jgi:hypothetical protein
MGVSKGYQPNIFRAVSGSLFSTPVNWSRGYVPTGSDVADIRDNCTIDITRTLGTLVVRPGFTASINTGLTLNISQSINVLGHLSCSGTPNVYVLSKNNTINSLSAGNSTFNFPASSQQQVPGVTYNNVVTSGASAKILTGNAVISGSLLLNANADLECSSYNLIVSGGVSVQNGGIRKSGFGNITFNSLFLGVQEANRNKINFSGNPNVEFKGGFRRTNYDWLGGFDSGYGTWTLSTNNQVFNPCGFAGYPITFNARLLINDVSVTMDNSQGMTMMGKIDGTTANSKLTLLERLNFGSSEIAPMSTSGTFDYTSSAAAILHYGNPQNVTLPYTYYTNIWVSNSIKSLKGNTSVSGALSIYPKIDSTSGIECAGYNLTVTGSTLWNGKLSKSGSGNIIFIGSVANDTQSPWLAMDFTGGNPNVEFRNGFSVTGIYGFAFGGLGNLRTGTGSFIFSTNNQSILFYATYEPRYFDAKIVVSGSITASYTNYNNGQPVVLNNTINGTDAFSKFINTANSVLYLGTPSALSGSFLTGSFDFSAVGNTVHLYGNYNATSSQVLGNLYNLSITGTGTKTLGTSSYISGALNVNGTFDIGSQNLTVSGASFANSTTSQIIKSGPGKVTFIGQLTYNGSSFPSSFIDFSGGNPTVELNRGISTVNTNVFNSGTGSWYFLSSSQKIETNAGGSSTLNFYGPMIIGPGVTLTIDSYGPININRQTIVLNNAAGINGTDSTSTLINYGTIIVSASAAIMTTGSFTASFATASTINYNFSGSLKLPYTSYANLIVSTGSVTLTGSTSVTGSLTVGGGTIFDLQANNLFISGTTTLSANTNPVYPFQKTQSGSIIFGGSVFFGGPGGTAYIADFSIGNPDLEFRNSISASNFGGAVFKQGSGSVYFTTNNQGIFNSGGSAGFIFSGSIKIGSGITVTLRGVGAGLTSLETVREIDGTDANSRFIIGTVATGAPTVYYNSPLEPMRTGSMDVSSSAAATFIYNSGSQNVKGGIYRNLTFLNGLKTLQGNVSVLGTFSTGSGATSGSFNLNGFTLTNP